MLVGVPKEIKTHKYKVSLTPSAVREYVASGHGVIVETSSGVGISAADDIYRKAGAEIVLTAAEIFSRADMVVKVKEPQPGEWGQLREGQILFTYLHLAPDPKQTQGLVKSGVTAIAYETVTDSLGGLPLLAPMSEVAGRLSIEAAGSALKRNCGGPRIAYQRRAGRKTGEDCRDRRRRRRRACCTNGNGPWCRGNNHRPINPTFAGIGRSIWRPRPHPLFHHRRDRRGSLWRGCGYRRGSGPRC
jgi:hypothetical protein